jgi:hypothetical protein
VFATPTLDAANPLDLRNSLSQGLLARFLLRPGCEQHNIWDSLAGPYRLRADFLTATQAWVATDRPGGYRHFVCPHTANWYAACAWGRAGFNHSRSAAVWVRPAATGATYGVAGAGNGTTDGTPLWFLQQQAGNVWAVYHGAAYRTSTSTLAAGRWQHLTYTYDHPATAYALYVNGLPEASGTAADNAATPNNAVLYAGQSYPDWYNGAVDDLAVWDRALSAAEVLRLYRGPALGYPELTRPPAWRYRVRAVTAPTAWPAILLA